MSPLQWLGAVAEAAFGVGVFVFREEPEADGDLRAGEERARKGLADVGVVEHHIRRLTLLAERRVRSVVGPLLFRSAFLVHGLMGWNVARALLAGQGFFFLAEGLAFGFGRLFTTRSKSDS